MDPFTGRLQRQHDELAARLADVEVEGRHAHAAQVSLDGAAQEMEDGMPDELEEAADAAATGEAGSERRYLAGIRDRAGLALLRAERRDR